MPRFQSKLLFLLAILELWSLPAGSTAWSMRLEQPGVAFTGFGQLSDEVDANGDVVTVRNLYSGGGVFFRIPADPTAPITQRVHHLPAGLPTTASTLTPSGDLLNMGWMSFIDFSPVPGFCFPTNELLTLVDHTGALRWRRYLSAPFCGDVYTIDWTFSADGQIAFGASNWWNTGAQILAIRLADGEVLWQRNFPLFPLAYSVSPPPLYLRQDGALELAQANRAGVSFVRINQQTGLVVDRFCQRR
jgi:hypothetical protein